MSRILLRTVALNTVCSRLNIRAHQGSLTNGDHASMNSLIRTSQRLREGFVALWASNVPCSTSDL